MRRYISFWDRQMKFSSNAETSIAKTIHCIGFWGFFPLVPPMKKSCLFKRAEILRTSENLKSSICWKFELSMDSCLSQKLVNPLFYVSSYFLFGIPFLTKKSTVKSGKVNLMIKIVKTWTNLKIPLLAKGISADMIPHTPYIFPISSLDTHLLNKDWDRPHCVYFKNWSAVAP